MAGKAQVPYCTPCLVAGPEEEEEQKEQEHNGQTDRVVDSAPSLPVFQTGQAPTTPNQDEKERREGATQPARQVIDSTGTASGYLQFNEGGGRPEEVRSIHGTSERLEM